MAKSNFIVRGGANFNPLYQELNNAQKKMNNFQGGISKALKGIGALFGGIAVGKLVKDFVGTAMRTETLDVAMQSVAKASGYATDVLSEHRKAVMDMGIAQQEATQILTRFMQAQLDTADASKLARVAQDAAVIAGMNSSEAAEQMTEAIAKQRPILLAQFGMMASLDDMYKAHAKTIGKTASQLTKAEKQQAMLNYILSEGEKIAGTYEASMGTVGKQIGSLPRYWQTLQNVLATPLALPGVGVAVEAITNALKSATAWAEANAETLKRWGQTVANVVGGVIKFFGFLGRVLSQNWKIIKILTTALVTYAVVTNSVAAATNAWKWATTLLNGNLKASTGIVGLLSNIIVYYKVIMASAAATTNIFSGTLLKLRAALYAIHTALGPIGWIILAITAVVTAGMSLWNKYTQSLNQFSTTSTKQKDSSKKAAEAIKEQAEAIEDVGKAAKKSLAGFDELNVLQDNTATADVGEALEDIADMPEMPDLSDMMEEMMAEIEDAKPTMSGFWVWLKQGFGGTMQSIKETWAKYPLWMQTWASKVFDAVKPIFSGIGQIFGGIITFLKGVFTADWRGAWEGIKQVFMGIWNTLVAVIMVPLNLILGLVSLAWEGIKLVWAAVAPWFSEHVITPVANFFSGMWTKVKDLAGKAWNGIKTVWRSVATWFNETIVTPISNFFGGLWQGIKSGGSLLADFMKTQVIDPIVSLFRGMYNAVIGIVEGVINGFVGLINGFITGINRAIDVINKIPGVSLPSISALSQVSVPRLAKGGIVSGATMAMIGEAGREAVLPLDNNTGWMDQLAERLSTEVSVTFSGDLAALGRVLNPVITKEQKRRGGSLVMGV